LENQQTTHQLLVDQIYPRLSASIIFADLKNVRQGGQGNIMVADCPACGKKQHFYCYEQNRTGYCHSGSCSMSKNGKGLDWWTHTKERYGLTRNQEVLIKLAELAGVTLPTRNRKRASADKPTTIADVRKLVMSLGQKAALSIPKELSRYLESRGVDQEMVRQCGFIYMDRKVMYKELRRLGCDKELLSQSGVITKGFGETYKLLLPYCDDNGVCIGFVGRLNPGLTTSSETPKYKNSWGTNKDVPFLFHTANKPGINKLIIVEGPIDAHQIINKCNLKNTGVVALCGDTINEKALALINGSSAQIVILALDDDKAGHMSTMTLLKSIKKSVFVVNNFWGHKDPGELIASMGPANFRKCLMSMMPASQWLFKKVQMELRGTPMGERLESLSEISPIYRNIPTAEGKKSFVRDASRATLIHEKTVRAMVDAA